MNVDPKALVAKLGPTGIAVVVLALAAILFFFLWQHSATTDAGDRLKAGQSGATAASGVDAVSTTGNVSANAQASEDLTRSNAKAIDAAPGSTVAVTPEAQAAGIAALCRRAAYRDNPRCKNKRAD